MKAKVYLSQLKYLAADQRRVRMQIKELEQQMVSLPSVRYDKENVQVSHENQLEQNVIRLVTAKQKLEDLIVKYAEKYIKITKQIDLMDNPMYREILKEYFVENRRIHQIADRLHYSEKYVYNCFESALITFENQFLLKAKND